MLAIVLGLIGGLSLLVSKGLNNAAANQLGLLRGSVLNYITGTITALALALTFSGIPEITRYTSIPGYYYLAGALGLLAMLVSNATLHRLPLIHSTALIITTQLTTALAIDYLIFGIGSWWKVSGAVLVILALVIDGNILKNKPSS